MSAARASTNKIVPRKAGAKKAGAKKSGGKAVEAKQPSAKKVARWEARVTVATDEKIERARKLLKLRKTEFLTSAAEEKADRILARADVTLMDQALFDELVASLDTPDPAPTLERLAARPRRVRRA